uniref:RNA-directed DNA polymerase n=1 Tax=Photinus pyralis TaxID=7054 RepID=A0A1Y1MIJ6_PHOPY
MRTEIGGKTLGRTHKVTHHINTEGAAPIKQRYHSMSPYMLEHLNKEIDSMLEQKVIKPSTSPWCSPVVMVRKKSGEFRLCFDGRKLNAVTKHDAFPLPHVQDILDRLRDARYISTIDLKKAFWQIPLDDESGEKTAFAVPRRGLFEFTVLPFGLHNAAQTLQRLMSHIFGPELEPNIIVYLDDIIMISKTFSQHISLLEEVGKRLKNAGLTINFEKCEFCKPSLKYLGYVVNKYGLHTDPDKVETIVKMPIPRNSTEVKRFLGMSSWYRKFIPEFSTIAEPILATIKGKVRKKQAIKWTPEAEEAFNKLKQLLTSAPILVSPDFAKMFHIQTDASDVGIGAVLAQGDGEDEKVIAYASRTLSGSEKNYSATEKECLAVLFGIQKFRPYVEGTRFKVITDHHSLQWLNSIKDPSGRLARWSMKLQQHDFTVEHRKGKENVVPDALSRAPLEVAWIDITTIQPDKWIRKMTTRIKESPDKYPIWRVEDNLLYKFVPNNHGIESNLVEWKLVIPTEKRVEVLRMCHDEPTSAHLGSYKTFHKVAEKYYWPKMKSDVKKYVAKCKICQSNKTSQGVRAGLMGLEKKINFPFQLLSMDLVGPLPRSYKGNTSLLVICDWFTKFVFLHPIRKATSAAIIKYLEDHVFLTFGTPQIVACDNGPQFTSAIFKKFMKEYGIEKIWYNAVYHPQANHAERINRVVTTAIRSYVRDDHKKWDENISKIAHAIRNAKHEVTGYTPSFLNFGRTIPCSGQYYGRLKNFPPEELTIENREKTVFEINELSEIYRDVTSKLSKAYLKNQKQYNLRKRPLKFQVGDPVWKKNYVLSDAAKNFSAKLADKFIPGIVKKVTGQLTYQLEDITGKDMGNWHVKDLKPRDDTNTD